MLKNIEKKICLIILNYNDSKTTMELVELVESYENLSKVIVIDNASTDGSYNILKKLGNKKVDVISTQSNKGYAVGNNFGAKYAIDRYEPDVILFANPDTKFSQETIDELVRTLYLKKDYAVAAPIVEQGYNAWNLPGYWGTVRMLFLVAFNVHKRHIKNRILKRQDAYEVGVVEGSFFAIKRTVFEKVKGFDERTFLYLEENILACKLREYGYKEVITSKYSYQHEHSKSIRKQYKAKSKAFVLFKDSFAVFLKYYLKANDLEEKLFWFFYELAMCERKVYDLLKKRK